MAERRDENDRMLVKMLIERQLPVLGIGLGMLQLNAATGHTGIASNCAQCHAYGLSFYNMAPPTLKQPASGATGHIPAVPPNGTGSIACSTSFAAAVGWDSDA